MLVRSSLLFRLRTRSFVQRSMWTGSCVSPGVSTLGMSVCGIGISFIPRRKRSERFSKTDVLRLPPMSEWQTEEEFRQHVNTVFNVQVNAPKPIDLTLVGVESRPSEAHEEKGMERFSVFFKGS